jgi:acyl carrier protein
MSEATTIAARVRSTLALSLSVDASTIKDERALSDYGGDSLDAVEAVMSIEDEFNIEIPDSDAGKLAPAPISEWIQYVEARSHAH